MRDFCKLNKDILFGDFINKYSDRSIAILVALMKFKISKGVYIYNKDFLFECLNVTRTNVVAKKIINESFDFMVEDEIIVKCPLNIKKPKKKNSKEEESKESLSIIKINESAICDTPWQKIKFEHFHTIFSSKTKFDKYKMLLVYLNIIKWFHSDDGYSFPTNDRLMIECGIKSEQSLVNIQKELVKLGLLCMKTHTFNTKDKPTTKNFYGHKESSINIGIMSYMDNLDGDNIKIINSEIANIKRSASMKIEHQIRQGIISEEEGDILKKQTREKINDIYGISNSGDEFSRQFG